MSMPLPGDEHRRLNVLVGRWRGRETMHPSPWDPEGCEAEAEIVNREALDGFAVIQDYVQHRGGEPAFRGHAVMTWNAHACHYSMMWWDSMGTPPNEFIGDFEAPDRLVLENENPAGRSRTTFELGEIDDGRYDFRMEFSADGATFAPFMDGTYERIEA